jgi:hypothetical protein
MGQRELLLIVLGAIVIGIAIVAGNNLFRQNAINNTRDQITTENADLAIEAVKYYKKPLQMGGGGYSFSGWKIPPLLTTVANGNFRASVYTDHVVIIGTGNELVSKTDSVKVQTTVYPDSVITLVIN